MSNKKKTGFKSSGAKVIDEVDYGVYVWEMPDGSYIQDSDGRFFCVASTKHNFQRYQALKKAVESEFGITEGRVVWFSGHRPVSDDEYEVQLQRYEAGLQPDIWDVAAIKEDYRAKYRNR